VTNEEFPRYLVLSQMGQFYRFETLAESLDYAGKCGGRIYEPLAATCAEKVAKEDWRIGLSCKPKHRTHEKYYDPPGKIIEVHPSGTAGITDKNGVLRIKNVRGLTFLAPAEEWVTA
jgi:hypothetical protein